MKTPAEHNKPIELHNKPVKSQKKPRSPKGQSRPYRDGGRWKQKLEFLDADGNKLTAIGTGSTAKAAQDKAKQERQHLTKWKSAQTSHEMALTSHLCPP